MQMAKEEMKMEMIEAFRGFLYERESAESTIRKYTTDIRTFFQYLGEDRAVDKQRILEYKGWLLEHYAVSSANSMLAALNQFFDYLNLNHLKVKRVKIQNSLFLQEEKELTEEEYRRLVEEAVREGKYQLALCMETIASTGIRISELAYFTVESVKKEFIEIFNKGKIPQDLSSRKTEGKADTLCRRTGNPVRGHIRHQKRKTKKQE